MDEIIVVEDDETEPKLLHQFAKFALGILAAFAASQAVEKAYDKFVVNRQKDYIEELD